MLPLMDIVCLKCDIVMHSYNGNDRVITMSQTTILITGLDIIFPGGYNSFMV